MATQAQVLCVGRDPVLLQTRGWVLEKRFQVETASNLSEVEAVLARQKIDLLVLCYTLRLRDRLVISKHVHLQLPDAKILWLSFEPIEYSTSQDHFVEGTPSSLLEKASVLVGARTC